MVKANGNVLQEVYRNIYRPQSNLLDNSGTFHFDNNSSYNIIAINTVLLFNKSTFKCVNGV